MNNNRRVVITGMGAITPLGNDLETFWSNLKNGVSGIHTIQSFDTSAYDCRIGGEVRGFDPKTVFKNPKDVRRTDRFAQLAMAAAKMAMADSAIEMASENPDRFGVLVSSGIGGLKTLEDQYSVLLLKGPQRVSAFTIPMLISNMASGLISMEFGMHGPNMCIVTACATSNNAIGESWRMIKFGDADIFLAGGSEAAIIPIGLAGFGAMKALSTRNDDPEHASRPWDRDRDGFVIGEGAGILILEELEHARTRGAKPIAEIVGYGMSGDAYHITQPAPEHEGGFRVMKNAVRDAKIQPTDIGYVNAHGTSTPIGDTLEAHAIRNFFGDQKLAVSSTKSMTGHLLGGAGGLEAGITALALRDQILPPTINLENQDPGTDGMDFVPKHARKT